MSWPFRSERGIGRGETAESRIEAPMFAAFVLVCAVALLAFHLVVQVNTYTMAVALSMLVFGATLVRVEVGLYILITAMLLSPEITAGTVGAHAERAVNLRYDDVLIVVIFLGVLVKLAFEGRPDFWQPNPVNGGIFAYYSVCVVASIRALYFSYPAWDKPVAFFVLLKMIEFYMVFFIFWISLRTREEVRRQLTVFFAVSMVVCLYGISTIGRLPRVSAPFEAGGTEPNTLGGYLMLVMCTSVGLYVMAPSRKFKLLFGGMAVAALIPFMMTLSRASYISLLVAMTILGVASRKWGVIGLVALVLVLSPFVMPQEVKDRVNYTFQAGSGVPLELGGIDTNLQIDKSTYERIYVWRKVRFNLTVWPWLGGGVSWENVLDSQYARVLIETGILGFSAFVFLQFQLVRTTRQAFRWSRDWMLRGFALGTFAATGGLIVHGLGTISFLIVRIMEPFWFMVAMCVIARRLALEDYQRRLGVYHAEERRLREEELAKAGHEGAAERQAS